MDNSRRRFFGIGVLGLIGLATPTSSNAHGGGLNAQGCHNNRKTGDYHCHRSSGSRSTPTRKRSQANTLYSSQAKTDSENKHRVSSAQSALKALGYYSDKVDGNPGPNTMYALGDFQREMKLIESSAIDDESLFHLVAALTNRLSECA